MNGVKEMDIKKHTQYFFLMARSIQNLDPNKTRIDEKSYKNLLHLLH